MEIIVRMRGMHKPSFQVLQNNAREAGRSRSLLSGFSSPSSAEQEGSEPGSGPVHGQPSQGPPSKHSWVDQFSRGSPWVRTHITKARLNCLCTSSLRFPFSSPQTVAASSVVGCLTCYVLLYLPFCLEQIKNNEPLINVLYKVLKKSARGCRPGRSVS